MLHTFLTSNEAEYRLARTIVQGVIGVIIANLDTLFGYTILTPEMRALCVAVCMAILSPIMAYLGEKAGAEC